MTLLHYLLLGIFFQAVFYYKYRRIWVEAAQKTFPINIETAEFICLVDFFLSISIWPWELFKRLKDGIVFQIKRLSISIGIIKTTFGFGVSVSFCECPRFISEILCGPLFLHIQYMTKENIEMMSRPPDIYENWTNESLNDFLNDKHNEQKTQG